MTQSLINWPCYSQEEIDAVANVLRSGKVNYWTGKEGRAFEKEFARFCSTKYAVALANGTVALEVALIALGIGPGDEIIVSPRTFIASASCIVNVGAIPVFADIDPDSQNITARSIRKVLTKRTRAVICVHLAGWPCEMHAIKSLADEHNLFLVEDCAQAHGAQYEKSPVGSIGDIGCWSFCQDKIITTGGEGGMVTTNSEELWEKIWSYKDHGKSYSACVNKSEGPGFKWLHESFGSNYRMTEMQAAIGRIQLNRLPDWVNQRQLNSKAIDSTCREFASLRVPEVPRNIKHARYKYYVFVQKDGLKKGWNRDRIIDCINERGVPCFQGGCSEVYLEKAFDDTGYCPKQPLEVAKELAETSLMFLVHPTLKERDVQKICDTIADVMAHASL